MTFSAWSVYFNSHAHVERDSGTWYNTYIDNISTHTLTWSVTGGHGAKNERNANFNSHAHVERDREYWNLTPNNTEFQLTRSRGA